MNSLNWGEAIDRSASQTHSATGRRLDNRTVSSGLSSTTVSLRSSWCALIPSGHIAICAQKGGFDSQLSTFRMYHKYNTDLTVWLHAVMKACEGSHRHNSNQMEVGSTRERPEGVGEHTARLYVRQNEFATKWRRLLSTESLERCPRLWNGGRSRKDAEVFQQGKLAYKAQQLRLVSSFRRIWPQRNGGTAGNTPRPPRS